jgi:uncharacterized OsmC-like protein
MTTSRVTYLGSLRTEAQHLQSGEKIITDAPTDNKGKGEAFSPTDLTATSLAACIVTTVGIGAEGRGIRLLKGDAEVTKVMASGPRRIAEIIVNAKLKIEPDTPENRETLTDIGLHCPVARSLHPDIKQTVTISYE